MRRLAVLSLHTSPLAQPGTGDSGGSPRDPDRIEAWTAAVGAAAAYARDGLGVRREVVDTAYSRALAKLRVHPRVIAVRDRMREAV